MRRLKSCAQARLYDEFRFLLGLGTIEVSVSNGFVPYSFLLDGSPAGEIAHIFAGKNNNTDSMYVSFAKVSAGAHTISVTDKFGCKRHITAEVGKFGAMTIDIVSIKNIDACDERSGQIQFKVNGAQEPYKSVTPQSSWIGGIFTSSLLGAGVYKINVTDNTGCTAVLTAEVKPSGAILQVTAVATTPTSVACSTPGGVISVTASGGIPPYKYQVINVANCIGQANNPCFLNLVDNSTFTGLTFGTYLARAVDAAGCKREVHLEIMRGNSNVSYASEIKPILVTSCNTAGCHDGTLGATLDFRDYAIVKSQTSRIRAQVISSLMPPPNYPYSIFLTQDQKDKIRCWIDDGAPSN